MQQALCDLGESINLMPLSIYKKLGLTGLKPTSISLQFADRSVRKPEGMIEDMLVKVGSFIFPADFVVLDMEESSKGVQLILGRPFLKTGQALIDVAAGKLTLRIDEETLVFDMDKAVKFFDEEQKVYGVDEIDPLVEKVIEKQVEYCMAS